MAEKKRKQKKKAQEIRGNGSEYMNTPEGGVKSHFMTSGDNQAWPTVFPNKKGSHDAKDWTQAKSGKEAKPEAEKRGEVFTFKTEKQADKFAHGSWKKGKDRRDAMKEYRSEKRSTSEEDSTPFKNNFLRKK
tara:strand:+ start:2134 stop:2529 length:396 start_codon:yes stop_codon:yes gene_type:complete